MPRRLSFWRSTWLSDESALLSYAVQMIFAANQKLALADGGGGVGVFADWVFGNDVELRAGADDFRDAVVGQEINESAGGDERGTVVLAEAAGPLQLAAFGVVAGGDAV